MSYIKDFFLHYMNMLTYRRKEFTVIENDFVKINKFIDSYYVKNKNVYITFVMDCCVNNVYNYPIYDKRINLYIVRIKKWNQEEIVNIVDLIKSVHNDTSIHFVMIHGFMTSKNILDCKCLFDKNIYHISITPFIKKVDNSVSSIHYHKTFTGNCVRNCKFEDFKIKDYHQNLYVIFTNNIFFLREKALDDKNIRFKYSESDKYLSLYSLILAKSFITSKIYLKNKFRLLE